MLSRESGTGTNKGKGVAGIADTLLGEELFWCQHQSWLEQCGYMLRQRYHPDWTPSWWGTRKNWTNCEDGVTSRTPTLDVMDATQISDGQFVVLKKTSKSRNPSETDILHWFSSGSAANDPRNHVVPILQVLDVPHEEDLIIIVMPLLRKYDNPWFDTVGEALECIRQLFEGLQFMHQNNIAHRDLARPSIMMDASGMYPEGFHPRDIGMSRDYTHYAKPYTRTQRPPKYYFIGFGSAKRYPTATAHEPVLDSPIWGFDKTVPEFRKVPPSPCDPFATDVYYLGNVLKEDFQVTKLGFEFMDRLIEDMTHENPRKRPTMDQVVQRFDELRMEIRDSKLRSRVVGRYDDAIVGLLLSVPHWTRRVEAIVRGVPPSPVL